MNAILPTPTPEDIEAALDAMHRGTSAFGEWVLLDDEDANATLNDLWWVTIVDSKGTESCAVGAGVSSREAAAVAWINECLGAWWLEGPQLSADVSSQVTRWVPKGWQFELYDFPTNSMN